MFRKLSFNFYNFFGKIIKYTKEVMAYDVYMMLSLNMMKEVEKRGVGQKTSKNRL